MERRPPTTPKKANFTFFKPMPQAAASENCSSCSGEAARVAAAHFEDAAPLCVADGKRYGRLGRQLKGLAFRCQLQLLFEVCASRQLGEIADDVHAVKRTQLCGTRKQKCEWTLRLLEADF